MDRMFSPWRAAYVTSGAKEPGCVMCRARERALDPDSLVVHTGRLTYAFLVFNLALAWVPVAFAAATHVLAALPSRRAGIAASACAAG